MSIQQEIRSVYEHVGFWSRSDYTVLQCSGKDAVSWLHKQTTNDVAGLKSQCGNLQALLDRQGRVQCFFSLHRWEEDCWIIIPTAQATAVSQRHETHCFLEEVKIEDVGGGGLQVCVEGPRALLFLCSLLDAQQEEAAKLFPVDAFSFRAITLLNHNMLVFRVSESGEDGFLLLPAPDEAAKFYAALRDHAAGYGAMEVSESARECLRIEGGKLAFGVDLDETTLISDTPLEKEAVSYTKGCYLGQEVVARVKAYTSPRWAVLGLRIDDCFAASIPNNGTALHNHSGTKIGEIKSCVFSPTLNSWLALSYLDREHRVPETSLQIHAPDAKEKVFDASIALLPFILPKTREEYARQLYGEALSHFEADKDDLEESSIALLKDAITLAPTFEDAYEALGVILHRHHRTDEAIHYMKLLAEMNPQCVMAHSNLSVFYVSKGMIQEAESEKAIAAQLERHQALDTEQAAHAANAERERIRLEAKQRITMFKEVLEIDPDDAIANMGLGNAYIQLEQYADAIPFLNSAAHAQKDYSAAWLNLGKCFEFLGQREDAVEAYTNGIAAASRKGDLMPMKEMQRRLQGLEG